jgi:hypothetical protein
MPRSDVQDVFFDHEGTSGHTWTVNQRCMNCGHAHDPVIEQNRMASLRKALALKASQPDYQAEQGRLSREPYLSPDA